MELKKYIEAYSKNKNITSKYSKSSLFSNLKRIETAIDKKFEDWNVSDFKNDEKIIDELSDKYQLNSVIVSISALKSWLIFNKSDEKIIKEYNEALKDMIKIKNDKVNTQEKNEIEKALGDDFDWEIIQSKSKEFIEKNIKNAKNNKLRSLLILGLFSLQPPARLGNYLNMEYRKGDGKKLNTDMNYLTLKNGKYKFIFNNYKTSKYLGKVELEVKNELLEELLTKYLKTLEGRNPILFSMSSSQMTQILKKTTKKFFKVGITLNTFRHAFATFFMKSDPSIEEKQHIAKVIGQTYRVSRLEQYKRIE